MALVISLSKIQQQEKSNFTINDVTGTYDALNNPDGYGAPNDTRADRANYLMVSKNDENGSRTFLTVANTDPLNTMIWSLESELDGWHQATMLSFKLWNSMTAYTATNNAIYHTGSSKYYRCIQNNTNIAPTAGNGDQYWTEIINFAGIQQGYINVDVIDYDFLIDARTVLCITDEFYNAIEEDFLCHLTLTEAYHPLNLIASLEGAYSKMLQDDPESAEQIISAIAECCE